MPLPKTFSLDSGESVVLSGISGRFPQSDNMREFARGLYEKRDLVDDQETRWRHVMPDIPRRTGKINNLDKFDAEFFSIGRRQRDTMDPQQRLLIEHAYEAILDAGVNPESIRGSRTGVFCGVCFSETEVRMYYRAIPPKGLGLLGCAKSQLVNRISYVLDLKGPSFVIDTACSSSMYALDVAYRSIQNGACDAAIIMGTNLTLHPYITYQFALLGVLSKDGFCRPFDKDASGYSRSEAICAIYLQKAKDAKRIYGHVIHSKTNCDGFKSEGITFPSGPVQRQLLQEIYDEIGINPSLVDYVEAHSTGTVVGDPEECAALDEVYCTGRDRPLPVGSVKSSIGHSESAAGVCSIAKCIIAMENGLIPPNIHFTGNKPTIPSLVEGRLKVVSEIEQLPGPLIGINSFGFGGANAHALICRNLKEKINHGLPEDDLPRLVVWSGRTKAAIDIMLQDITRRALDTEFLALLYNIQKEVIPGHRYCGYGIYRKNGHTSSTLLNSSIMRVRQDPLPLVVICGGINKHWRQELAALRMFSQVAVTTSRCRRELRKMEFDLDKITSNKESTLYDMVGTIVLQLSIVDLLKSVGVKFDSYGGHSVGQFICAYIDNCLSLEDVIKLGFCHGLVYSEYQVDHSSSAFVKLNNKLKQIVLKDIAKDTASTFAIFNSDREITPKQVHQIHNAGFATEELTFINLRSGLTNEGALAIKLRKVVGDLLPKTITPTRKWITANPSKKNDFFCSPELHNTSSVVYLFEKIPKHTHVLELDGNRSCENVLKILNRRSQYIPDQINSDDIKCRLLAAIGQCHATIRNLQIANLYPTVEFPVSRGTTMISPLILWDHRESAFVVKYNWDESNKSNSSDYKINLSDENYKYIAGHCIDGRVLFPATGYLQLVSDLLSYINHRETMDLPLEYNDVRFLRATTIAKGKSVTLRVMIQEASGFFEITEGDTAVVTGYARFASALTEETVIERPSSASLLPTRDFYKELRLRGYHYSGLFKSVLEARSDGCMAKIRWTSNWVSFLDCLLQVGIIAIDTRSLMVPTSIDKITIDPKRHLTLMETDEEGNGYFTMRSCSRTNVSVCGGIVISNARAMVVSRRNPPGVPVLETYQFVPSYCDKQISALEAIRMCVQLALENVPTMAINVAEIDSDELPLLVSLFGEAVGDLPLVKSNLTLLTNKEMELENVTVSNEKLASQTNLFFLITSNGLSDPNFVRAAAASLVERGFVLLRENNKFDRNTFCVPEQFNLVSTFSVDQEETFVLLQLKNKAYTESPTAIRVNSVDCNWLPELKQAVKLRPVVLYSQNDATSGIVGLVNCIRKEPKMQTVRCVFIDDESAPNFSLNDPFYSNQLNLGLAVNVYKNGVWGSYRHALLKPLVITAPTKQHCYANCLTKGDLSSMTWFTGPLDAMPNVSRKVRVVYSALNFRDAMVSTGRLSSDALLSTRLDEECELGYEFAGIAEDGRKVMGTLAFGGLATIVRSDPYLTWTVPDEWSLEEACTIPLVYGTVVMAFYVCTQISRGKSILIHAGSGGVGLAAIQVAFADGLEVFTTVSTQEKKDFLLKRFPQLKKENIGNSRDLSFEQMVKLRTNGRGVDFVLNSLSEEKLQASVRCLAKGGHFLEIGKYDMARNSKLAMELFQKGITFTSVLLDMLQRSDDERKRIFYDLLEKIIARGIIKPLNATVFDASDVEKALRFLASGKHTGKILLKLRQNETDLETLPITYSEKIYCNPEHVYVIIGGLGGFGLELADWLVLRGCKKLVFSSSRGISKPYQEYRIKIWKSYGVETLINTANITTRDGCYSLIKEAAKLGPVAAIYNLAVQLRDSILDNQTTEKFEECLAPKAKATDYLDVASRELCPQLKHFVVFSSVSCGRGNAGQSNYGMANSIMERIVERRHADGLPAKAIQWGAIGEVGLVADMAEDKIDMEIGGTLQQRISSCLQEMDRLLACDDPIVASMVVAEKRAGGSKNIIEAVMNIMNIRELKSVSMESTLADIGMDSLMAVEIKQVLERDFELVLSPQELRTLSFEKLLKLEDDKKQARQSKENTAEMVVGMQILLRNLGNEANCDKTILRLKSANEQGNPILIIPGIEGMSGNVWDVVAEKINAPVYLLQLFNTVDCDDVPTIVDNIIDDVCNTVFNNSKTYIIMAYSFGSLVSIEVAKRLQAKRMSGKLLLIDGAPKLLKHLLIKQLGDNPLDRDIQKALMALTVSIVFPNQPTEKLVPIVECPTFEEQISKLIELAGNNSNYSPEYTRKMAQSLFKRVKMTLLLNLDEDQPLDLPIMLVKPTEVFYADIEDDYGLSHYTTGLITQRTVEGSHMTVLDNPALVDVVNSFCV